MSNSSKAARRKGKLAHEVIGSGSIAFSGDPIAYIQALRYVKGVTNEHLSASLGKSCRWLGRRKTLDAKDFVKLLNILSVQVLLVPVDSAGRISPYRLPQTSLPEWQRDPERMQRHREKALAARRSRQANAPEPL